MSDTDTTTEMSRRGFLASSAAAAMGASLAVTRSALGQGKAGKVDDVNVGMIGVGTQGGVLLSNMVKMKGIRLKAACDIWPYRLTRARRYMKAYNHEARTFVDYRDMLGDNSLDLDAVIVATPDWMHAEHAIACMKAGLHVYCEKEMSNTLAAAGEMVRVARKTGRLLQIGHQRRSNPRYLKAFEYIRKKKALGRITHVNGHWNRHKKLRHRWAKKTELDKATLNKYGYATMDEFRNWRWYKKFSGGPIADLGSHQIDVFNWVLGAPPRAMVAAGGNDYYKDHQWYDNINVMYEWDYDWGGRKRIARGFYQILNTTSHNGYFETFMGDEGSMVISENTRWGGIRREDTVETADWETSDEMKAAMKAWRLAKGGKKEEKTKAETDDEEAEPESLEGHSPGAVGRFFPIPMPKDWELPVHRWHLENFLAAVRDPKKVRLNCPGEVGYETAASVLPANESLARQTRLTMKPEDFQA